MTTLELVLRKLKLDAANPDIELAILETEQKVRNYCNIADIDTLPAALNFTVANMTIDLLKYNPASESGIENLPVKSVTMGETSYTFDIANSRQILDKLLLDYESDLKKFRRLKK